MGFFKDKEHYKVVALAMFGAMLANWLLFTIAHGAVNYPPGALLQTGDVTSNHIRNATILDVDIATTSRINHFKIGQGLESAVPFFSSGLMQASSTGPQWYVSTTTLYSPGQLSVVSTTTLRGVGYNWPAADGTAGTFLSTSGGGQLSWGTPTSQTMAFSATAGETIIAGAGVGMFDYQPTFASVTGGACNRTGSGTSLNVTVSTSGNNRLLLAWVQGDVTNDYITGVTYNGQAMTLAHKWKGNRWLYLFYKYAPTSGSNTMTISASSATLIAACGVNYQDAAQSGNVTDIYYSSVASNTVSTTTTYTRQPNSAVSMLDYNVQGHAATGGTNATVVTYSAVDGLTVLDSGSFASSPTTTDMTANDSPAGLRNNYSVAIAPVLSGNARAYMVSAATSTQTGAFAGLAPAATAGNTVSITGLGIKEGYSSLTISNTYYLQNAKGSLGASAGTYSKSVGTAVASTTIFVK